MFLEDVPQPHLKEDPEFLFLVSSLFDAFERITRSNFKGGVKEGKFQVITDFIHIYRMQNGDDIYPSAKLIFPQWAGRLYYMKEVTLARLIIKMFNIPKSSEEHQILHNWKHNFHITKRTESETNHLRNLPLRAAKIIVDKRKKSTGLHPSPRLTVTEVNDLLDSLSDLNQVKQMDKLKNFFSLASVSEIRWFIHIVLKKPILAGYEAIFFECWHPDAWKLYGICNSLQKVFNYLLDPDKRLGKEQLSLQTFWKFKPQLATKLQVKYDTLVKNLKSFEDMDSKYTEMMESQELLGKFFIEEKMDGDRMVLHKFGDNFKFYSRRLKDYSFLYGERTEMGSLTKYLTDAFVTDKEIILDGEMVAWDFDRKVILPFGTLKSSAVQESVRQFTTIDHYEEQHSYPYYLVFDILRFGNLDLRSYPLFYRRKLLEKIINPVENRLEILPIRVASTSVDITDAMKEIIARRGEGILVKHVQSQYEVGRRSNKWFKIKPEYLERFGHNLDLAIIGKEPGIKNSYMCGLRNSEGVWLSFCMVANGFSQNEYAKIESKLGGSWRAFKTDPPPPDMLVFGKRKPMLWIDPTQSLVLEVKARDVNNAEESSYAVGSTLHCSYCRSVREDKSWREADTLDEYIRMKLTMSDKVQGDQRAVNKRLKRDSFYEVSAPAQVSEKSQLMSPFNFIILSGHKRRKLSKEQLQLLVRSHGGNVINRIDRSTNRQTIVISEKSVPSSIALFKRGFDLVKPEWIEHCTLKRQILQLEPALTFKSHFEFRGSDAIGDSYLLPTPLSSMHVPQVKPEVDTTGGEVSDLLFNLFRGYRFLVVASSETSRKLLSGRIERFGGHVVELLGDDVGYIVISEDGNRQHLLTTINSLAADLAAFYTESAQLPFFTTDGFIDRSILEGTIVDPEDFKYV
ncbi:DNA ligase 4 [Diutina catenulata]